MEKYKNHITELVVESDEGQTDALIKGFKKASGDIYCWLNADDTFTPNALQTLVEKYQQHPDSELWIGATRFVDPKGKILGHDCPPIPKLNPFHTGLDLLEFWGNGLHFMQPSVFFSSKAYEKVGGLNKRFDHLMDIELWTKICLKGSIFTFDVVLSEMKIHRNQKSNKQINIREMEYISLKHQYGLTEKALQHLEYFSLEKEKRYNFLQRMLHKANKITRHYD